MTMGGTNIGGKRNAKNADAFGDTADGENSKRAKAMKGRKIANNATIKEDLKWVGKEPVGTGEAPNSKTQITGYNW